MSKPDPTITADLLSKLPTTRTGAAKAAAQPGKHDHSATRGPQPSAAKISSRSAEKSSTAGRTRTSNRGK
jgi:hypothetical protein